MKLSALIPISIAFFLELQPATAFNLVQLPIIEDAQHAINLNPFKAKITKSPHHAVAPTPSVTSSSSSSTCDFAPRPTGTCELGEMEPFPFNCTMFYMCTTFGPIMQNCPNGTVFDLSKSKCILKNATTCTGCCKKTDCDAKSKKLRWFA